VCEQGGRAQADPGWQRPRLRQATCHMRMGALDAAAAAVAAAAAAGAGADAAAKGAEGDALRARFDAARARRTALALPPPCFAVAAARCGKVP